MSEWPRTEVYADAAGQWRWHRQAENGRIVAASGEAFDTKDSAIRAAETQFPDDPLVIEIPARDKEEA